MNTSLASLCFRCIPALNRHRYTPPTEYTQDGRVYAVEPEITILIRSDGFFPQHVSVAAGTTVMWQVTLMDQCVWVGIEQLGNPRTVLIAA